MRIKKLRGHKRRWKHIENWKSNSTNFDESYFLEYQRDYTEILIHPWSNINLTNSTYAQPNGKTKRKMLEGLLDIFEYWNRELVRRGHKFSLYLWLYDNRFNKSQVVCGVGDFSDFYDKTFEKSTLNKKRPKHDSIAIEKRLSKLDWNLFNDEDYYDDSDLGTIDEFKNEKDFIEQKKWYKHLIKRKHRDVQPSNGHAKQMFTIKEGCVWVGKVSST